MIRKGVANPKIDIIDWYTVYIYWSGLLIPLWRTSPMGIQFLKQQPIIGSVYRKLVFLGSSMRHSTSSLPSWQSWRPSQRLANGMHSRGRRFHSWIVKIWVETWNYRYLSLPNRLQLISRPCIVLCVWFETCLMLSKVLTYFELGLTLTSYAVVRFLIAIECLLYKVLWFRVPSWSHPKASVVRRTFTKFS